eukprot:9496659-Karenia_brevis.AAC.1
MELAMSAVWVHLAPAHMQKIASRTYNVSIHPTTTLNRVLDQTSEVQSHTHFICMHLHTMLISVHVSTISCTAGALSCGIISIVFFVQDIAKLGLMGHKISPARH